MEKSKVPKAYRLVVMPLIVLTSGINAASKFLSTG